MKTDNLNLQIEYDIEQEILLNAITEEVEKEFKSTKKNKKKITSKKLQKRLKSGLQIKTVLLLLLTLLVNTYAWFIYVATVSTGVDMHVNSWDFELSDASQSQDFSLVVEQIYPGMPTAQKEIKAKNNGETEAALSCEINRIQILDEEYVVGVDYTQPDGSTIQYTSDQLLNKLLNDYPFKVKIYINGNEFNGGDGEILQTGQSTTILLEVKWDYESGEVVNGVAQGDETDTYWGMKSYEYMQNNPDADKYSVQVDITIKAVQRAGVPANP